VSFKNIISIHGVPRSGTSWLGQIFDSSPDVRYKFQPLFSYAFKDDIHLNSNKFDLMKFYTKIYNYTDSFLDQKDKKEAGLYSTFSEKKSIPPFLITKMVRYHYLIPHLLETLENIIIIGIIRNPCGVMNSWKNAPREFLEGWIFKNEWRYAQSMNRFRPEQFFGFNKWKESTKLFLEMKKKYPKRVYLVKYEDLVKNPVKQTKELFDFCGIDLSEQTTSFINASTSFEQKESYSVYKGKKDVGDWKEQFDDEIKNSIFKELNGTEFEEFLN